MFPTAGNFLPLLLSNFLAVFRVGEFWLNNLLFIFVFLTILFIFAIPLALSLRLSPRSNSPLLLLLFPFGLINLLVLLLFYQTLSYFFALVPITQFMTVAVVYFAELLIALVLRHKPSKYYLPKQALTASPLPLLCFGITFFLGLYIVITSRHFDPQAKVFFIPGYELNHDSLNLVSSVKLLLDPQLKTNNLAARLGSLTLHSYPAGSSHLALFFSVLFRSDPYFIYSRLITAVFLLIIFPLLGFWQTLSPKPRSYPRLILVLLTVSSVINFLTVTFLNTGVMAAVINLPLIITLWLITYLWLTRRLPDRPAFLLVTLTLTAGVFVYIYIIYLYLLLFLIGLKLTGIKIGSRRFIQLTAALLVSLIVPHNFDRSLSILKFQFTSLDPQINLLHGMSGNIGFFLNPFMALSLWFSHPLYLVDGLYSGNSYLIAGLVLMLIMVFALFPRTLRPKGNWRLLISFTFPSVFLLFLTVFISHSTYQTAKVLQLASFIWPFCLYLIFQPYLLTKKPVTGYQLSFSSLSSLVLCLIFAISVFSGLFAMSYIGKPDVLGGLTLLNHSADLCSDPQIPLQIITRDEWAKYFLIGCQNLDLYFDRSLNWDRIVAFNHHNRLTYLSQPCQAGTLELIDPPSTAAATVLVDYCFNFQEPDATLSAQIGHFNVFVRSQVPSSDVNLDRR